MATKNEQYLKLNFYWEKIFANFVREHKQELPALVNALKGIDSERCVCVCG